MMILQNHYGLENSEVTITLMTFITYTIQLIITLGLTAIFITKIDKAKFVDLGFSLQKRWLHLALGLLGGFLIISLGSGILLLLGAITIQEVDFAPTFQLLWIILFAMVAVNEETFARGYILRSLMITFTRPGKLHIGSPGQPLPKIKIEIRDGEIVAKGPNIMQGYFNRPDETTEVIKDGWLYTGDLGRIDKKGYLYITGRKKEIIVLSNGKNVNPSELEAKLEKASDCIREAGVFMITDKVEMEIREAIPRCEVHVHAEPEENRLFINSINNNITKETRYIFARKKKPNQPHKIK